MLLLRANIDDLQVITGEAGDIEPHVSAMIADNASPPALQAIPDLGPLASITTATTTTIVDTASITDEHSVNVKECSLRNNHASQQVNVTVQIADGTNTSTLAKALLLSGEVLLWDGDRWIHYDANMAEYPPLANTVSYNASSAAQGAGFATDTYLTGSYIKFPVAPKVGTKYKLRFDVTKTAAGTATPIITVRLGTAGTTADTARNTLTFNAGTAAVDAGVFELFVVFRAIGSGTSAITQARCALTKGATATTGIVNLVGQAVVNTSGGFDSTVASLGIGVSVNGGTSASWTVQCVDAELVNT